MTRKRSKGGCEKCKHRRVRCDEKKPRCANCARRNELCSYVGLSAGTSNEAEDDATEAARLAITPFLQRAPTMPGARLSFIYYQRHMLPWRLQSMKDTWWDIPEYSLSVWDEPAIDALIVAYSYAHLPRYGYMAEDAKVTYFGLVDFGMRRIVRHGPDMPVITFVWCCLLLGVCELGRTADATVLLKHLHGCVRLLESASGNEADERELAIRKGLPGYLRSVIHLAQQTLKPKAQLIADAAGDAEPIGFMSYESAGIQLFNLICTSIMPATSQLRPEWISQPNLDVVDAVLERWQYDFDKLVRRTLVPADTTWKRHFLQMHQATADALLLTVRPTLDLCELETKLSRAVSECENVVASLQEHGISLNVAFNAFKPMGLLQPLFVAGLYSMTASCGEKARTMLLTLSLTEGNWSSFAALRAIREQGSVGMTTQERTTEFVTSLDVQMRELALSPKNEPSSTEEESVAILRSYGYIRHGTLPIPFVPVDSAINDVRDQLLSFKETPKGDLH